MIAFTPAAGSHTAGSEMNQRAAGSKQSLAWNALYLIGGQCSAAGSSAIALYLLRLQNNVQSEKKGKCRHGIFCKVRFIRNSGCSASYSQPVQAHKKNIFSQNHSIGDKEQNQNKTHLPFLELSGKRLGTNEVSQRVTNEEVNCRKSKGVNYLQSSLIDGIPGLT